MPATPPDRRFLVGLLAGLIVGIVVGLFAASAPASPAAADGPPPTVTSSAGPSCADGARNVTGWTHVMANGQTWAVTLNATVVHPPGTTVAVNVSRGPTGTYDVAFETVAATGDRPAIGEDCRLETTVNAATSLQEPEFEVTVDGRRVRAVDQDETVANLYPLPNPLNATR